MIDVTAFRDEYSRRARPRPLRPGRGRKRCAGGAAVLAWDDARGQRDAAAAAGVPLVDLAAADLARRHARWCCRPASRTLSDAASGRCARPRRRRRDSSATSSCWRRARRAGALCRHHRHQRQIDDDGADRPYPRAGRPAASRSAAISARRRCRFAPLGADGIYVLEMSSYQLELDREPRLRRRGAAQHHARPSRPARRHGGYIAAKERIFAAPAEGADRDHRRRRRVWPRRCRAHSPRTGTRRRADLGRARRARRRLCRAKAGSSTTSAGAAQRMLDLRPRCAAARQRTTGRTPPPPMPPRAASASTQPTVIAGIASFPGLAHRQELGRDHRRRALRQRSKATNADAAAKALACYDEIYWIAGGLRQGRRHRLARAVSSRASATPS